MALQFPAFKMFVATCTGNAQNTVYSIPFDIASAEDLAAACRKDHVCTEFKDNRRSSENFIRCYAVQADCDNDNTEDPAAWITPATVAERLPGIAFYAVKSRNCDKVKHPGEPGEKSARPRWHYYFPLRVAIPKIHIIREIMARLLVVFPEFDRDGMKPAQPFFGHAEPVSEYYDGEKDIAEYFCEHPEITAEDSPAEDAPADQPEQAPESSTVDDHEFLRLNLPDMLAVIPSDDYDDWISIGMALKAAGEDVSRWDEWSKSSAKYPGYNAIVKKWNSFKRSGKGPGTLVYYATLNGWESDPDKLTGEYRANYDAAEQKRKERANKHRERVTAALAAVGMPDTEYSESLTVTYNFDGSVYQIVNMDTGEVIFDGVKANPANPAAAAPAGKPKNQLITGGYDDVETKPADFLFFPWFPRGKLVSIQGDSGSSKSTFSYGVGALVSTGSDLLGVPCEDPGNVMFITIEDDPGDIKTAFLDSGGDLSRLKRIINREDITRLTLSPDGAQMINNIIKAENIKLLVLDPIQQFLTGDMNKANDTRPQLARLMNIAAENNNCIAFIEHMGKDTSKSSIHRGIGSVDIGASTRSMIQVVTDPEDDFYKIAFTVKNNTADPHDTQRAIRYQVKDHPGSFNRETGQRDRFHGHAEFCAILPEYNERLYKRAVRKTEEAEEAEEILQFSYDDDPLVITVRKLISYNPEGLFIGSDDLIQRITQCAGHCPYELTRSKLNGLNNRISKLRKLMLDTDGIQADIPDSAQYAKAYKWQNMQFDPQPRKIRGVYLTPVRSGASGSQQTKF